MNKNNAVTFENRAGQGIDLSREGVTEISSAFRELLADVFALYLKTKNFHWHMSGRNFRDYHLLPDEQGDQLFAMTDEVAERARKIGGTTLHSISEISAHQRCGQQPGGRQSGRYARRVAGGQPSSDGIPTRDARDLRAPQRRRHHQHDRSMDRSGRTKNMVSRGDCWADVVIAKGCENLALAPPRSPGARQPTRSPHEFHL